MRYLIPSYRRCGMVKTLGMLHRYGVSMDDVTIGTQTECDYDSYSKAYTCHVIYCSGKSNAAGNRNALMDTLKEGETFCLMDDGLNSIAKVNVKPDGTGITTKKVEETGFNEMMRTLESMLDDCVASAPSHYSFKQSIFREIQRKGRFIRNSLIEGSLIVSRNGNGLHFDESVPFAEDYEASLRIIADGHDTMRTNEFVVQKVRNGKSQRGGCTELYARGDRWIHEMQRRYIVERYPGMVMFMTRRPDETRLRIVNV